MPRLHALRTEMLARRYLASRGDTPMVEDPLHIALPRLRAEVVAATRLARLDLTIALGLLIAAMTLVVTAWLAPMHGGLLVTLLHLHLAPLVGLGVAVWAAIVLERSGPRLVVARRIARALQAGALFEALELAVCGLPGPHTA
ncbi:hypothetical protein CR162_06745 [Pseudoroseomonas rhizosphaerae]|uniref:Uncharacterized protein n=1 Tax=Teichococcus rhizosphaerae TaxID=1335062 RepID=A0A2C6Y414_9PROT|nr:hypothetical protein [Pseudoroseomonas rhizosphaerae]PHK95552.1 hypothetical protein CR162_06745 [Pseudoroseomonas rhizosphaerae]